MPETQTISLQSDARELFKKYLALKERITKVRSKSQQDKDTTHSRASTVAFIMSRFELNRLVELMGFADNSFADIFTHLSMPELAKGLHGHGTYANTAKNRVEILCGVHGLTQEVAIAIVIKDIDWQIYLIDAIVLRAETSAAAIIN